MHYIIAYLLLAFLAEKDQWLEEEENEVLRNTENLIRNSHVFFA
jgi:hypothetical protein